MTLAVRVRRAARHDLGAALFHYAKSAGEDVSVDFAGAVETVIRSIRDRPKLGAPYRVNQAGMDGVRKRRVGRFPYLLFYIVEDGCVDILRVLHVRRDIPQALTGSD